MDKKEEISLNQHRSDRVLSIIIGAFVTCYIAANVMSVRVIQLFGLTIFDAGTLIFPATYLLGNVMADIWGYRTTRRVVFFALCCQIVFVGLTQVAMLFPSPADMQASADAFCSVFGMVPRIMGASLVAFCVGELLNARVLVHIRKLTNGKHLWMRTIGSSIIGFTVDTTIFVWLAFGGVMTASELWHIILIQTPFKILVEICASTPLAYLIIARIRRYLDKDV